MNVPAAEPGPTPRRLLIFTAGASGALDDVSPASNTWYIRRYEEYFDHVFLAHLTSRPGSPVTIGRTTLLALGTGQRKRDLLCAPWRLLKLARRTAPTHYLVSDLVWSWWLSALIVLFCRAKVRLLPLVIPQIIYRSGRSISVRLPIGGEKVLISLSYLLAHRIVVGKSLGDVGSWFRAHPIARSKLYAAETLVEAIPSPPFFEGLNDQEAARSRRADPTAVEPGAQTRLLYVGRLNPEKLLDDLVRMVANIVALEGPDYSLTLSFVGEGSERKHLEWLATDLGVRPRIEFLGYISNRYLPQHYLQATAFVSPLTGVSLREAALCGTPILAYDMDWIHGLLEHEKTALLVPRGDHGELARQAIRIAADAGLRERLSRNVKDLAWRLWSPGSLRESLHGIFGED